MNTSEGTLLPNASQLNKAFYVHIIVGIAFGIIFLTGTIGNGLVIYTLGYRKVEKTTGDYLVISLAITDFLASILIPYSVLSPFFKFDIGEIQCNLSKVMSTFSISSSWYNLIAIAADRYRIIRYPFNGNLRRKTTALILILIWASAVGAAIGAAISAMQNSSYRYEPKIGTWECKIITWRINYIYNITSFVFSAFVPVTTLIIIYMRAAKTLAIQGLGTNNVAAKKRKIVNQKVVKLFTIIVCLFAVLTIPFYIFSVVFSTCIHIGIINSALVVEISIITFYILLILSSCSCCVNPLIYSRMHKDVCACVTEAKRRFSNYFCCCCQKNSTR